MSRTLLVLKVVYTSSIFTKIETYNSVALLHKHLSKYEECTVYYFGLDKIETLDCLFSLAITVTAVTAATIVRIQTVCLVKIGVSLRPT